MFISLSALTALALRAPSIAVAAMSDSPLASRGPWLPTALDPSSPGRELRAAWKLASLHLRQAGSYRFIADAEQALLPRPIRSMIGESDERLGLRIEGDVTGRNQALPQLRLEGAGLEVVVPICVASNGPTGDDGIPRHYLEPDGVHLSPEGHMLVADLNWEQGYEPIAPQRP